MPVTSLAGTSTSALISAAVCTARVATECSNSPARDVAAPSESARLLTAQRRQLRPRRAGVQPLVDVGVGLPVPHQHQPTAHRADPSAEPPRSPASQRAASSDCGGGAPATAPVGQEPR